MTAAKTPDSLLTVVGRRKSASAAEVVRLYRIGLTMGEIAGIYEASPWVIGSHLDAARGARRAPGWQDGLPVDWAVHRYRREPHLLGELSAGLGIHPHLFVDRVSRPAPAIRDQGTYRAAVRAADVADLYRADWTVRQIAGRYRTTACAILHRLEQAGVTQRPKSLRPRSQPTRPRAESARRRQPSRLAARRRTRQDPPSSEPAPAQAPA